MGWNPLEYVDGWPVAVYWSFPIPFFLYFFILFCKRSSFSNYYFTTFYNAFTIFLFFWDLFYFPFYTDRPDPSTAFLLSTHLLFLSCHDDSTSLCACACPSFHLDHNHINHTFSNRYIIVSCLGLNRTQPQPNQSNQTIHDYGNTHL